MFDELQACQSFVPVTQKERSDMCFVFLLGEQMSFVSPRVSMCRLNSWRKPSELRDVVRFESLKVLQNDWSH